MIVSSAVLAAAAALLASYLPKLRRALNVEKEAGDILKDMLTHLDNRLKGQEQKLVDQQVRIDVLELKLKESQPMADKKTVPPEHVAHLEEIRKTLAEMKSSLVAEGTSHIVASRRSRARVKEKQELSPVEEEVVRMLLEGPKTAREIQHAIGRSREHTARLLKRLFDWGYVLRDEMKRPFVYRSGRRAEGSG